jgi:LPS export ABC transporter protein LptC
LRGALFCLLTILLFCPGCRINYELAGGEEDETIPDIYMEGLRQIQTTGDETSFTLQADRASFFTEERETFFENMEFQEIDETGDVIRRGSVGKARSYNKNDADLSEGVTIESYEDKVLIEGDAFTWKEGLKQLTSPRDTIVRMVRDGDTTISGTGFHADFKLNEIGFDQSVEGSLQLEN